MKKCLLSILLCLCLILSGMTVLGAGVASGGGGGGAVKPFIPSYEYLEDGETYYGFFDEYSFYESDGYLQTDLWVPNQSGGMHGFGASAGTFTKVNGRTYSSISQLEAAIPINIPVQVKVDELQIGEYDYTTGIYEINFDATPVSYNAQTYSAATGTFQGFSKDLPIFYCMIDAWDGEVWYNWYYPYLDGNHLYDLNVYDYGIVITNMYASSKPATLYYIGTENATNGKMLSNIRVATWADTNLTGYYGELYDSNGAKIQSKAGELDDWGGGIITFTDLPAEAGTYTIQVWGLSGNTVMTPIYSYEFEKRALELYTGTVTRIQDRSNQWGQIAEVYIQLDEGWEREFYCLLPVEVGDVVCTTTSQLIAAMPVGSYVTCADGEYNSAFRIGEATTAYDNYGAISRFQIAYNTVDEYVRVELALPDGTFGEYSVYPGAKIGDEKQYDINEIYDYFKRNNGVPASFNEEDGEITHFTVGEEGVCENRYDQTYSYSYETFRNLSNKEKKLPIYYTYNGMFYPAYLDEDHHYDLAIYNHGIVITNMSARYMQETVKTIECNATGNRNLSMDLGIFCNVSGGVFLKGQLFDAGGWEVQEASAPISGGEADLVFADLPNTNAEYSYSIWAEDNYGNMVSPFYRNDITVKALPSGTGTITNVRVVPGSWDSEESCLLQIRVDGTGATLEAQTADKFYIDGERYIDMNEVSALLQIGTKISYIGDADGNVVAVNRTNQPAQSYGSIVGFNRAGAEVSIVTPDGTISKYTVDEYTWLNGHFMGNYSNLESILNVANSWYVAYTAEDGKLTSLKTGTNSTNYAGLTYSGGKFSELPASAKNLPVYYSVAGMMADPILNENHVYDVILYDYAIEVVDMKAKNMDATICYVNPFHKLNSKFFQDITVEVLPYVDKSGAVVKAQLLDSKGYILAETSQAADPYRFMGISFPNRPNEDTSYTVKVWVEDSSGTRISPNYTKKVSVEEAKVSYGTIVGATTNVNEYGEACVVLEISIPGLDRPVTVTCPLGTVINGVEVNSQEDLETLLATGTLVKIAESNGTVSNVQFVDSMQNITGVTVTGNSVSADINFVNKTGQTITGTAYTGVYTKDGALKKITATPFSVVAGQPNDPVPVQVEGITYTQGDYLKVVCMDENGRPLCNVMKVDID